MRLVEFSENIAAVVNPGGQRVAHVFLTSTMNSQPTATPDSFPTPNEVISMPIAKCFDLAVRLGIDVAVFTPVQLRHDVMQPIAQILRGNPLVHSEVERVARALRMPVTEVCAYLLRRWQSSSPESLKDAAARNTVGYAESEHPEEFLKGWRAAELRFTEEAERVATKHKDELAMRQAEVQTLQERLRSVRRAFSVLRDI